ncbi:M14 family zinc carboxypeptidase [Wenzhouxiangella limi]|uniref:Peptidase n=1 Tax=Wenzhouxiangella limi TaxID=2707351 RepID=A0A845V9K1_9GAMM|nr:M14 family zinc carboxypeptidase [Wenzhouxiangella limi]NDY96821.1 peptidase [Wenzhouxiangella limi]
MRAFLIAPLLLISSQATAADSPFLPETRYVDEAPALAEVVGHELGERISTPAQIRTWFETLAETWPERIKLVPYAESWQGRELFYAVIGTPERIAALDEIQADIQVIAHPHRHESAAVEQALARVPGTYWYAATVHGNEISPSESAMQLALHLLAADDDPVVDEILEHSLVFINPVQNPDGLARFIHEFEEALGLEPIASRLAAEHDEPWPTGRVNHYLFDLNRDWLAMTQPETQGHAEALLDWYPLAFVDAHEMGTDSTFFFAPEAVPYNPLLASGQRASLEVFGRNNARWFDRFGFPYFTREVYDAFYPGYGASWPSYYGGVAMTYEQGSARGLLARTQSGEEFTFYDTVEEYFIAALATAQTVARERDKLWSDFAAYRRQAVAMAGRDGPGGWVIPVQDDQGGADRLASLLARHGAEVFRADDGINACGRDLMAGSYLIPGAQPSHRKLRVLLDERVEMDADFLAAQERRRARDLPDEIYDVTAWSLPLMFNVDVLECNRSLTVNGLAPVTPENRTSGPAPTDEAAVAWIVPGGSTANPRFLAAALRRGLNVLSNEEAFVQDGNRYPSGSLIVPVAGNPEYLADIVRELAEQTGARAVSLDSSWVTEGPSLGSRKVRPLVAPRIAMAWDASTDFYSAGAVRFVIEHQIGYPVTPIRGRTLARADLNHFDVLILPDSGGGRFGSYASVLGESGATHLAEWVDNGGVLVTMADATEWAAHPDIDLLALRAEYQAVEDGDDSGEEGDQAAARVPGALIENAEQLDAAMRPAQERPDSVSGVLVRAAVDEEHWLGAGIAETVQVLVRGDRIFAPLPRDQGATVARFAGPDELLASGQLWQENRRQLAYKPFVVVQRRELGLVVGFTEDPAVRAYLDGLQGLLANAVLRAPSYSRRLR